MNDASSDSMMPVRLVDTLMRRRRSVRAYKPDVIPREQVLEILEIASAAPSNSNTQPWRVYAVAGEVQKQLTESLVAAFKEDTLPSSQHFPTSLPECFVSRQEEFARRYYSTLGVERADASGRARQSLRNLAFFGAPVGLVFTIDRNLRKHSWLDLGLYLQNVMLAAEARGIATCPQVTFARFHPVIASCLAIPDHEVTACGMSMGIADAESPVNGLSMPRLSASTFACFSGFE